MSNLGQLVDAFIACRLPFSMKHWGGFDVEGKRFNEVSGEELWLENRSGQVLVTFVFRQDGSLREVRAANHPLPPKDQR